MRQLLLLLAFISIAQYTQAQDEPIYSDELSERLHGLKYRNIGPYRGGRSNTVSGVVGDQMVYYMGTVGGGIYKTIDAGINWVNVSDGQLKSSSVGALAVSESDPNVIYAGMGEHAIRGVMTSYGDGVYKSTDAGKTWHHIGLDQAGQISRVRIHPANPDIAYVAVQGLIYGTSTERGIYKTVDGGVTWEQVLYVDDATGAADLSMDMNNPRILYASMWDHQRYPWMVRSGGDGSGIYKSVDSGKTWDKLSKGLPTKMGKVAVDVSRADSDIVYANIEADQGGVYKSTDAGKSWSHVCKDRITIARAWYYIEIYADPVDPNVVYVMNAPFLKSIDGGKTFTPIRVPHGDQHDLWINPHETTNMINANDGGANISFNGGASWSRQDNQATPQFYRVITDNQFPYRVYAGQQDNSSVSIMSRTDGYGVTVRDWTESAGGESAFLAFDEDNPSVVYGGSYQGNMSAYHVATGVTKDVMAYPVMGLGSIAKDMKYRFNWNSPIIASPQDPQTMYHGGNHVLMTNDGGLNWKEISPDLTRNDKSKQGPGGIPFTNEGAGGENYNCIAYLAASPHEQGLIYVGTDDGLVHITKDEGANWKDITPTGLTECLINDVEVSPHDPATVIISVTHHKWNDNSPKVYISTDYGTTWALRNKGIQEDAYVHAVREDRKVPGLLYAGTERGLFVSHDMGMTWQGMQLNLPQSPINDLTIRDNDLVIATSGRGFWILDDLSAIQKIAIDDQKDMSYLVAPKATYRYGLYAGSSPVPGIGQNPLPGVILDYHLAEDMDSATITLDIMDASGSVVRSYSSKKDKESKDPLLKTKKGLNRFNWNMRTENLPEVKGLKMLQGLGGHIVAPGNYKAKFVTPQDSNVVDITILPYEKIAATQADYDAQYKFLNDASAVFTETHETVNKINEVKAQLESQKKHIKADDDHTDLLALNDTITTHIDNWLDELIQPKQQTFQDIINFPNQLNAEILDLIGRADGMVPQVTGGSKTRLADLTKEWNMLRGKMQTEIMGPLRSYNAMYKKLDVPAVIMPE